MWDRKRKLVICRLLLQSHTLIMDEITALEEGIVSSPNESLTFVKEDTDDRLATRNSFQIIGEKESEQKTSKRKKIKVKWLTHQLNSRLPVVSTRDEASQTKAEQLPFSNQNQRLLSKDQFRNLADQPHQNHLETKTKRNKIFSHTYKSKRHHIEDDDYENFVNAPSITKRFSEKFDTTFRQHQEDRSEHFQLKKKKQRWILHEININPIDDFPTAVKEKFIKAQHNVPSLSKLMLSNPKITSVGKQMREDVLTPTVTHSLIFKPGETEAQNIKGMIQEEEGHSNPAAKKIKNTKNKQESKGQRCSFSKLTLQRLDAGRTPFGNESRTSNCLLPECLIKDNLVNYNIRVVQSSSSGQDVGDRYYDTQEESPIKQKVSYRNIDIQHPSLDEIEEQEEGYHNLFSDFEFPSTPQKNMPERWSAQQIFKSNRAISVSKPSRAKLQFYLIGLAVLLLVIQMFG